MFSFNVELGRIRPNPWQTRRSEPPAEYIAELAADITVNGLLQIPIGRFVNAAGVMVERNLVGQPGQSLSGLLNSQDLYVEIAFGHNRLAAYRHNTQQAKQQENFLAVQLVDEMPVEVRSLTNEQMAAFAWSENERRLDLTPIERALAIQQRIESFGWTQEQAAERLQISRSRVAHLLRLLNLPQYLQDDLQAGRISERQAEALLTLSELPEHIRSEAELCPTGEIRPQEIVAAARNGVSSDEIRDRVGKMIDYYTADLGQAPFPQDHYFGVGYQAERCDQCSQRIQRGAGYRCPIQGCLVRKTAAWQKSRLPGFDDKPAQVTQTTHTTQTTETERVIETRQAAPVNAPVEVVTEDLKPAAAQVESALQEPPAAAPAATGAVSWEQSTVNLTLTWWPAAKDLPGRMVTVGGRANQDIPVMRMVQEGDLQLAGPVLELLEQIKAKFNQDKE